MPVDNERVSTGELYSQRIDALEAYLALQFKSLKNDLVQKITGVQASVDAVTKSVDKLTDEAEKRDDRLREVELAQAKIQEYREGHKETHTKERGILGTLVIFAGGLAAYWDRIV